MSPSEATDEATRGEWRELGFFYDVDEAAQRWRFIGSRCGLQRFANLLLAYSSNSSNVGKGEHDHYGPYMYLKVMTWPDAGIDVDSIHGTLDDLTRLAQLIEQRLQNAKSGERIEIADEYTPNCKCELSLEVRDEGFDPAEEDPYLR